MNHFLSNTRLKYRKHHIGPCDYEAVHWTNHVGRFVQMIVTLVSLGFLIVSIADIIYMAIL